MTTNGKVLGQHRGFEFYTIGQRGGLGVGGGTPLYVVDRRPETNEVVVAMGADDPALFRSDLVASGLVETIPGAIESRLGKTITARIRYRQPLARCVVNAFPLLTKEGLGEVSDLDSLRVYFDTPQRAIAPGQFVAFYDGEEMIGSAVIN